MLKRTLTNAVQIYMLHILEVFFFVTLKQILICLGSLCTVEEPVAIKIMKSSSSEEEQRRLLDEANALIALQHENVIQLLGFVSKKLK